MHTFRRFLSPEAPPGGSGGTPTSGDIVRTPKLPRKDNDVKTVANLVAEQWAKTPDITLLWIKQAEFAANAAAFGEALGSRQAIGSSKSAQVQVLQVLDKAIDAAISSIKIDIQQKFTKELAIAQYARYGMVKQGKNYILPRDRDDRASALKLTLEAVTADGVGGSMYGITFWKDTIISYANALNAVNNTDGGVATKVADKNNLKAGLLAAMRALQLTIQANYPGTYEGIYRDWGWQKENY